MSDCGSPVRSAALVLFCRRPVPGQGKRRLAGSLGEARTLAVASALLACALEDAVAWPERLVISPARAADAAWAGRLTARDAQVVPQPEGSLGERIAEVDTVIRAAGCDRVLFIGSDAPSLRLADLTAARAALDDADVVLIPSADGGVTLMGSRVPWPCLTELPWSQATLGESLERRCRQAGRTVTRLGESYDIDAPSDFLLALEKLRHDTRTARRSLYALLSEIVRCESAAVNPNGPGADARSFRRP